LVTTNYRKAAFYERLLIIPLVKQSNKQMKLVDTSGNEMTSKNNESAQKLEQQMSKNIEKLLEPVMNKIKLSGANIPQQQLVQLSSAAQQMLFNRMVYNLLEKIGVEDLDDILTEDDVEELSTSLKNQVKMVDSEELRQQMQQRGDDSDLS
jgi:tRNA(Glu) U13 pseudouridine synthase TruD